LSETPNLIPALPEIFLGVTIMALLMLGVFQKSETAEDGVRVNRLFLSLSIVAIVLTGMFFLFVSGEQITTFNDLFITDKFATFCKILILIGAGLTLLISLEYLSLHQVARFEFSILALCATLGMLIMVSANDLISLYVGLEVQSLSLYVIASFRRDDQRSTEAGLKYFVLGALASGMLLYGSSLIYGFAGTTRFDALADIFAHGHGAPSVGVIIGIVFILAGLAFKVSAVPFHMWTPDVYVGSPTPVPSFFAVAPKVAACCALSACYGRSIC